MNQKTMPLEQVKKVELFGEREGGREVGAGGVRLFFLPAVDGHYGLSFQVQCGALDAHLGQAQNQKELCHLVEHMVAGTPVNEGEPLAATAADYFADFLAITGLHDTNFTAIIDDVNDEQNPEHLLRFVGYMHQALYEAELTEEVFLREKEVVLQETAENKPKTDKSLARLKSFFSEADFMQFYDRDPEDVKLLTFAMCQKFYQDVFCKAPLDVVLMGDFPVDDVVAFFAEKDPPSWHPPPQTPFNCKPFIRLTDSAIEVPVQIQEDEALRYVWLIAFFWQLDKILSFGDDHEVNNITYGSVIIYTCPHTVDKVNKSAIKQALVKVADLSQKDFEKVKDEFVRSYSSKENCIDALELEITPWYCGLISDVHKLDFSTFKIYAKQQKSLPIL